MSFILNDMPAPIDSALLDQAADDFASAVTNEGREGARAFMEKRQPNWASDYDK